MLGKVSRGRGVVYFSSLELDEEVKSRRNTENIYIYFCNGWTKAVRAC